MRLVSVVILNSIKLTNSINQTVCGFSDSSFFNLIYLFTYLFIFFETGLFCVALAALELTLDQASLKLIEIHLPLPPKCWD